MQWYACGRRSAAVALVSAGRWRSNRWSFGCASVFCAGLVRESGREPVTLCERVQTDLRCDNMRTGLVYCLSLVSVVLVACRGSLPDGAGGSSTAGHGGTSAGGNSTGSGGSAGDGDPTLPQQACAQGTVAFEPALTFATAGEPSAVLAGEFGQGPGVDLFVLSFSEASIRLLFGNGNALFPGEADQDVLFNDALALTFAVSDATGDGVLDLLMPIEDWNTQSHALRVYRGDGSGTFGPVDAPDFIDYPASGLGFGIVVADIVGSSALDVAIAQSRDAIGQVEVLDGGSDFASVHVETGLGIEPWAIAAGDMNGDGRMDLVVADTDELNEGFEPDKLYVLLNDGDAFVRWTEASTVANPRDLSLADVDGDGLLDVIVAPEDNQAPASDAGSLEIFHGTGGGNIEMTSRKIAVGSGPSAVRVSDLNCDGVLDLAVANTRDNSLGVLWGVGEDTFSEMQVVPVGVRPSTRLAIGQFNADEIPDLAVANFGGASVSVVLGAGQ